MKITIISLNYYPEDTAIGLYSTQMAEFLSKNHNVEIVTAFPYYPQWKIYPSYLKKSYFLKEEKDGIIIHRSRQYVPSNPSFLKRILLMSTFTFGALINIFRLKNKPDLVISIIPFTSSAFIGILCKWLFKSKVWTHVQDFEFDAAVESGLMNKSIFLQSLLFKIEKTVLNNSDIVSTISESMISKLKFKTNSTTYFLPNWIEDDFSSENAAHEYIDKKKFNVLYSGNIGEKQDWNFFLNVVKSTTDKEIVFTIVGDGSKKAEIEKLCESFSNVKFFSPVPFSELPSLLSAADVHILFQKKDVIDTVMPSKILGMLASKKVSIVTGNQNSEINTIFTKNNIGIFSCGNESEISKILASIKNNPKDFDELRINAPNYVHNNFSKSKVLSMFTAFLENLYK